MEHDASDILGGQLPVRRGPPSFTFLNLDLVQWFIGAIALLLLSVTWHYVEPSFRQWRERRYKKAIRRRHGIPDNDNRPFNVAFAAAKAAQKAENGDSRRTSPGLGITSHPTSVAPEDQVFRQRHRPAPNPRDSFDEANIPQDIDTRYATSNNRATVMPGADTTSEPYASRVSDYRPESHLPNLTNGITASTYGKHARDEEEDQEQELKKTRFESEDPSEEDAIPEHGSDEEMEVDDAIPQHSRPISKKRAASAEDDDISNKKREKRARKVSNQSLDDVIMEDDNLDPEDVHNGAALRGKKRERAEVSSSFGGDGSTGDEDERLQRHRKRRTVSHKNGTAFSRGQKRSRDVESEDSEEEGSDRAISKGARKRRSKKNSDASTPGDISQDPLCKGRRIGEEWETNGVRYKVGPNGQRLRQELVKKSRSKFPMPSDSQHPDRHSNIDVFVETWLSEEEYLAAKERNDLAWQDTPRSTPVLHSFGYLSDSPSSAGKSLLWSSASPPKDSPTPVRGPFRQSVASNINIRTNFLQSQSTLGRRISSPYNPSLTTVPDSPKIHSPKTYSKWEKQDLEAAAMAKIREKALKETRDAERKDIARPAEEQKQKAEATASTSLSTQGPPQTSTISFPAMATKPAETASKPPVPLFGAPSTSNGTPSTKATTTEAPKLNIATDSATINAASDKSKSTFTFGAPTKPSDSGNNATVSTGTFGQTNGAQPANTTSTAAPASSIPNFFAKPSTPLTAPAPASTSSAFGAPAPASTSSTFGAPPSASTTSAFGAPATASTGSAFGAPATASTGSAFGAPAPANKGSAFGTPASATALSGFGSAAASNTAPKSAFGTAPSSTTQPSTPTSMFAAPSTETKQATTNAESSVATSGNSLLSRLGPPAPPSSTSNANASTTPASTFFAKPSAPAAATASASNSATAAQKSQAASSSQPAAPKFNFGFSSKPAESSTAAAPATSTEASSSKLPAPAPATSTASSSSQPLKFNFGTSGATNSSSSSPFGAPNTAASSSSPFGTPAAESSTAATSSNPFGVKSGPNAIFGSTSAFGANQPTPSTGSSAFGAGSGTNAAKSTFGLGNTSSAPAASSTGSAFGTPASSSSSAFGAPASFMPFGAPLSSTTSAFRAPPSSTGSALAAPLATSSTPAAPSTSTTTTQNTQNKPSFTFNFGAPSSGTSSPFGAQPSTSNGTAAPTSAFGSSTQPTPSAFGFGNPLAPSTQPTPSAFGFGNPSSTSSGSAFGSNGQNQK